MREKDIEKNLVKKVKDMRGLCLKFISPSMNGVPDRILLFPKGRIYFAELKAPGKKLRPLQEKRKKEFENLGFKVFVIDSNEKIKDVLDGIYTS
ncbi:MULTISPECIES: VRR-NUC domain-containing protein [Helcococcus]|uniref:VRR-NUC domain-containing protein n=1 Tax=Helcococcus bovis TaxID=3153252 RepID=A0ABW9F723_9FIRM